MILFFLTLISCGRECDKEDKKLTDTVDLQKLRPKGIYYLNGNKLKYITFNSDSTAVYKYKMGDSTYEISYKVKVKWKTESSQIKFKH